MACCAAGCPNPNMGQASACASFNYAGQPVTVNGKNLTLPAGLGCLTPAAGGPACPTGKIAKESPTPISFFNITSNSTQNSTLWKTTGRERSGEGGCAQGEAQEMMGVCGSLWPARADTA